jgi:hypothetical protein
LRENSSAISRILIVSDDLIITSEQQFAPLLRHRALIGAQLGIVFEQRLIDDVLSLQTLGASKYAAAIVKLDYRTPAFEAIDKVARLRSKLPPSAKLIYFDGDDDVCVQWTGLLELVDLYVKKSVFSNPEQYRKRFVGKTNLTDYVAGVNGRSFADNIHPHSGPVPDSQLSKIVPGYSIALDDIIFDLYRNSSPASPAEKTVDVVCRASATPDNWIYPLRGTVGEALMPLVKAGYNVLLPGQRVTPDVYYQEMRSSRICVSPFGYGELCWRDFEAVLCGCLLVKPDVSHLRTEPDIFIPGETYVPIRWDFSDLAEVCARYLADGEARNRIAARAYQVLSDYYRRSGFLDCFRKLLAQAGVAAATGEKAATLEEVNS